MKKTIIILICIFFISMIGTFLFIRIDNNIDENDDNFIILEDITQEEKIMISNSIEISGQEEKTTPNTLIIYKTYYTKCRHFVQDYQDIDISLVNLTEEEFNEKCKNWDIEEFSSEEIVLSQEKEEFCNEHYKLKLENNNIVIYNIDENGIETEYEYTGITTEYLTEQDILKLTAGIYVYGKENLTSTIEDYE